MPGVQILVQNLRVLEIVSSIEGLVTCRQEHFGEVAVAFQVVLLCFPVVGRQASVLASQFDSRDWRCKVLDTKESRAACRPFVPVTPVSAGWSGR